MGSKCKQRVFVGAAVVLLLLHLFACEDATSPGPCPNLQIFLRTWQAPDNGGVSEPILITALDSNTSHTWTIECDSDWLTLSADSGSTPGKFTVTATENLSGATRVAQLTITLADSDRSSVMVTVKQNSQQGLIQVGHYGPRYCLEALFVEGDFAYMGGCRGGLILVDISDPTRPYDYSWYPPLIYERRIVKSGDYVYLAGLRSNNYQLTGAVEIYEVTNPLQPHLWSRIETGYATGLAVSGDYLYIADFNSLRIYNVADPYRPDSVATIETSGETVAVAYYQDYVIFGEEERGLVSVDVSDPEGPGALSYSKLRCLINDLFVADGYLFLAGADWGLLIFNLADPAIPEMISWYETAGKAYRVHVEGDYAFVASQANYVEVLSIADIAHPTLVAQYETPSQVTGIAASGDYVYVLDQDEGLIVMRFLP